MNTHGNPVDNLTDRPEFVWQVQGWRPNVWRLAHSMELGVPLFPDIPAIPCQVPGSVQGALQRAGLLPDWLVGTQSRECAWVENYHWELFAEVEVPDHAREFVFQAESLDHSGWILLDGRVEAQWEGSLLRQRFCIDPSVFRGRRVLLSLIFDVPPREQGQFGFTSRSKHFKPRFSYGWDWCPRFVSIGVGQTPRISFESTTGKVVSVQTSVSNGQGTILIQTTLGSGCLVLQDPCGLSTALPFESRDGFARVEIADPQLWWPNGRGKQTLYQLKIWNHEGRCVWADQVGFKSVRWLPCDGAPADAEPWICEINGEPVFLQGVNWTPACLDYLETRESDVQKLVNLYKEMGCNVIRVWGGSYLESADLYRAADQAGLLVWQEFPLSSSGIDNYPPEDASVIQKLVDIARDYLSRRSHHACLLLWCGGNELQRGEFSKEGIGRPVDRSHPCLKRLAELVAKEAPGLRFVPTSASGPRFTADARAFGKGLHHDVHGPWNIQSGLDEWKNYWDQDDALFRSEAGMPGSMTPEQIQRYSGGLSTWPPDEKNLLWMHTAAWWRQWDDFRRMAPELPENLESYCQWSRSLQADALRIAASACKARFPSCGGFLVWMGHDCFPCPANTSLIDIERRPKPAYFALQEVFTAPAAI